MTLFLIVECQVRLNAFVIRCVDCWLNSNYIFQVASSIQELMVFFFLVLILFYIYVFLYLLLSFHTDCC